MIDELTLHKRAYKLIHEAYFRAVSPGEPLNHALIHENMGLYLRKAKIEAEKEAKE